MKKSTYLMSWVTIAIAFIFVVVIGGWLLYPYQPVSFDHPLEILNCPCQPGDIIQYHISGVGNGAYPVTVSKSLIDGIIFSYPSRYEVSIDGEFSFISADAKIPDFVSSGNYILITTLAFEVNPVRTITLQVSSDPFEVIADN